MAIVVKDRVKVTFTTTGTADFTLGSASLGFQSFAIIGDGNETYYAAVDAITGDWEVGIGTYTTAGPTLTRTTILESSAAGAKVSFSSGSKDVFVTYPAERAVYLDTAGSYPVQNTFNTLNATTATLTGGTVSTTPFSATDLVNKSYVDTIAAQGIVYHDPVYVESPSTAGNLTAIYTGGGTNSNIIQIANGSDITFFGYTPVVGDQFFTTAGNGLLANTAYWIVALVGSACQVSLSFNGAVITGLTNGTPTLPSLISPGVGAILTNNGTKAALTIDGVLMTTTKRVLIYNQTNAFENGVYTVTTVGTPDPGGTNWVLTRAADADIYGPNNAAALGQGDAFYVQAGNTGAGELYSCNVVGPIVFGVTNITFAQISATVPYFAGTGLNLSPATTFNISNVGTAGTYGSASNVPVFVTNAQGQVTSVTNTGIAITSSAVSGLAASATTDTTDAANITSGVLPSGRISGSYTGLTGTGALAAGSLASGFTAVSAPLGGTGFSSYAVGDLLYASTSTALSKLADVAVGNALISGGVGSAPSWGKIGAATHISGTLPVANGGTGVTSSTGTIAVVLSNSPTLVTPALGTPSALVGTNITGTAAGLTAGTVTTNANLTGGVTSVGNAATVVTNANLTGAVTSVGNATSLGSFTSAQLLGALTDETGTGSAVFATSPTLVTPLLGTPTSGNLANCTFPTLNQNTSGSAGSLSATLAVASGGTGATTLTANNVLLGNGTSAVQFVAPSTTGNVLTSNGTTWTSAAAGGGFPAGTAITFNQTAAPTGWTKSTTHDNKALRVVSGTVGSGGSVGFTTALATPTVTGSTTVSISGTTGATTLSTAQMPSHTHPNGATNNPFQFGSNNTCLSNITTTSATGATGGGGSHTHSFSGSGSGSLTSGVATINVQYVDVIIATKN